MQIEFYEYVKKQSNSELMEKIMKTYVDLKGSVPFHPTLGHNGALEFAGLLLLWDYVYNTKILEKDSKYQGIFWDLMVNFGLACLSMPPLAWSNVMDETIYKTKGLISYEEWSSVFCHLQKNLVSEIRCLPFALNSTWEDDEVFNTFYSRASSWKSLAKFISEFEKMGFNFSKYGKIPLEIL